MSEYETCLREGCDSIVKTQGLCSAHYMARWRAEQKILEEGFSRIDGEFGGIKDYICEGRAGESTRAIALHRAGVVSLPSSPRRVRRRW